MNKKLITLIISANVLLALTLLFLLSNISKNMSSIKREYNNELNTIHLILDNLHGDLKYKNKISSKSEQVFEPDVYDVNFEVLTKEEVLDLLKLENVDENRILSSIAHVTINGERRYLKKDILSWFENEKAAQIIARQEKEEAASITKNKLSIKDLSLWLEIPLEDSELFINTYGDCIPHIGNGNSSWFSKTEIKNWLKSYSEGPKLTLNSFDEELTLGETSRYLNTSMDRVEELTELDDNPLPFKEVNGLLRFNMSEVNNWLSTIDPASLELEISNEMGILDYIKYQNCDPETFILDLSSPDSIINYKIVDGRMVFNRTNTK